ncbi:hypothetical protein IWX49DRAFT_346196 [Phyllosticta citricarpa]|uniref:Transmembrane protein n=1 Tax=Phyllosticta citricarpa TaxID=55181 RepID=A0ABR1LS76_9PEZI
MEELGGYSCPALLSPNRCFDAINTRRGNGANGTVCSSSPYSQEFGLLLLRFLRRVRLVVLWIPFCALAWRTSLVPLYFSFSFSDLVLVALLSGMHSLFARSFSLGFLLDVLVKVSSLVLGKSGESMHDQEFHGAAWLFPGLCLRSLLSMDLRIVLHLWLRVAGCGGHERQLMSCSASRSLWALQDVVSRMWKWYRLKLIETPRWPSRAFVPRRGHARMSSEGSTCCYRLSMGYREHGGLSRIGLVQRAKPVQVSHVCRPNLRVLWATFAAFFRVFIARALAALFSHEFCPCRPGKERRPAKIEDSRYCEVSHSTPTGVERDGTS